jgi:hypothetical protein
LSLSRREDQISESSTEDFRNKLLTPKLITAMTGKLSDGESDVRQAAVNVVGKLLEHGWFDFQIVEESINLISDRGFPDQVLDSQDVHCHHGQVE